MQVERYRIILTGWVMTGHQTRDVISELSHLFKIPEDRVRPLLVGEPSIIRRDLSLEKAERLRNKIEKRGAVCSIKRIMREEIVDSSSKAEGFGILEPDLNMDSTQFVSLEQDSVPYGREQSAYKGSDRTDKDIQIISWRTVSIVLLVVAMVAGMAWGYFYLNTASNSPSVTPKVFTFSPAKGTDT